MFSSKILTKSKFSLGGITMGFTFFKKRDQLNYYRRKPLYLFNTALITDLDCFILLNRHI
jgi:hypothetical protein